VRSRFDSRRAQALPIVAITLLAAILAIALAVDGGVAYLNRTRVDTAVTAALAEARPAMPDCARAKTLALDAVQRNGFPTSDANVNCDPTTGDLGVQLSHSFVPFFAGLWGGGLVTAHGAGAVSAAGTSATITQVIPSSGVAQMGANRTVSLLGSAFSQATGVQYCFDPCGPQSAGTDVAGYHVYSDANGDTHMTILLPDHEPATIRFRVLTATNANPAWNPGGPSYTWIDDAPLLSSIEPAQGSAAIGARTVLLTGRNLDRVTSVTCNNACAYSSPLQTHLLSDTQMLVSLPGLEPQVVTLTLNPGGSMQHYSYGDVFPTAITNPASGPAGMDSRPVLLTGTGLQDVDQAQYCWVPCNGIYNPAPTSRHGDTELAVLLPPHEPAALQLQVHSMSAGWKNGPAYNYQLVQPSVSRLSPTSVPNQAYVSVIGNGFTDVDQVSVCHVCNGSDDATQAMSVVSQQQLVFRLAAQSGWVGTSVSVRVHSLGAGWIVSPTKLSVIAATGAPATAPSVTQTQPSDFSTLGTASAPLSGGNAITFNGRGFTNGAAGETLALVSDSTRIVATIDTSTASQLTFHMPVLPLPGTYYAVVTTPSGPSNWTQDLDAITVYAHLPLVNQMQTPWQTVVGPEIPANQPGESITITGSDLATAPTGTPKPPSVTINGLAATVVSASTTSLTVTAPQLQAGIYDVVVTTPEGSNPPAGPSKLVVYDRVPNVIGVSPSTTPFAAAVAANQPATITVNVSDVAQGAPVYAIVDSATYFPVPGSPPTAPQYALPALGPGMHTLVIGQGNGHANTTGLSFIAAYAPQPVAADFTPRSGSFAPDGPTGGGTVVTVTSSTAASGQPAYFDQVVSVTVDGYPVAFTHTSPQMLTLTMPPHAYPGNYRIVLHTAAGEESPDVPLSYFTYHGPCVGAC